MEKVFDATVTAEAKARFSFLERYEGFCVDLIKVKPNQFNLLMFT